MHRLADYYAPPAKTIVVFFDTYGNPKLWLALAVQVQTMHAARLHVARSQHCCTRKASRTHVELNCAGAGGDGEGGNGGNATLMYVLLSVLHLSV